MLPDCRAGPTDLDLTPAQRLEVFRALAQDGEAGLERWLEREQARDPRIRARVEAARAALEREVRARRRAIEDEVAAERVRRRDQAAVADGEMADREAGLRPRLHATVPTIDLTEALLRAQPAPTRRRNRLLAWLLSVWAAVVRLWVRLVRRLRGKPAARGASRSARFDASRLLLERPELRFALRLEAGPGFRARMRQAWERLAGREDYDETLRRIAEREAEAARAQAELDVRSQAADAQAALEALRRERDAEAARRRQEDEALEERLRQAAREEAEAARSRPLQEVASVILADLRSVGLVDGTGTPTDLLLERFSALLQEEAFAALPGGGQATPGHYAGGEGEYERGPMRSLHELGAIELSGSLVQARTRHPKVRHLLDEDVLVHRELRQSHAHVVVVLDTSGSMEEQGRLDAAKRVALVLHRTVRQMGPEHRVDLVTMATSVARVDLSGAWNAKPGGFTNFGAALREAGRLFDAQAADRRVLYLVTDGLPEAMTLPDGRDVADSPRVCLPDAVKEATRLGRSGLVRLVVYQLESKDPMYVEAARKVAAAAGGRVEVLDPAQLMRELLVELGTAVGPEAAA